jgi:phosphotriesterase-related protein
MLTRNELRERVQTVLGLISPDDLGVTLPHEHCLIDIQVWFEEPKASSERYMAHQPVSLENLGWIRYHPTSSLDNLLLRDEQMAVRETLRYKRAGGNSLVDVTSIGLGRDPSGLARISRATGLNIIMGTGYYVKKAIPSGIELTAEAMAERMTNDILEGAGDTGIRAGIIGELGIDWPMGDWERMTLRAAGQAQRQTGDAEQRRC